MSTFLFFIFILVLAYTSFVFTSYLKQNIKYKEARSAEIKRRLQVEHKNEVALNEKLKQPMDDKDRIWVITKAAHDRHQRAVHYVIEDIFEKYQ
jgi:hypothetical protein